LAEALIAYLIANILDIVSTNLVLKRGGVELNPILRSAMDKFGKSWFIPKFALAGIALGIFLYFDLIWAVWAGTAFYGLIALNNFRTARKLAQ